MEPEDDMSEEVSEEASEDMPEEGSAEGSEEEEDRPNNIFEFANELQPEYFPARDAICEICGDGGYEDSQVVCENQREDGSGCARCPSLRLAGPLDMHSGTETHSAQNTPAAAAVARVSALRNPCRIERSDRLRLSRELGSSDPTGLRRRCCCLSSSIPEQDSDCRVAELRRV